MHLDLQIFSKDYNTEPEEILEVSGDGALCCGEQAEMMCWVCWVPTEDPERRGSIPADILSKESADAGSQLAGRKYQMLYGLSSRGFKAHLTVGLCLICLR